MALVNRSLWLLIVFFGVIIAATLLLIDRYSELKRQEADSFYRPFRIYPVRPPKFKQSRGLSHNAAAPGRVPDRESMELMVAQSLEHIENDEVEEAEDKVRTVLVFDPDNFDALTILGRILFADGKYRQAELVFRHQRLLEPDDATVLNNLGSSLARQDKLADALVFTARAWEKAPDCPEFILNYAGLLAMNGDKERAVTMLRKALEILGPAMTRLVKDKCFDPLRSHPGFKALEREAAESGGGGAEL